MMTRGGEGVSIPPKNDDVIYEQPLRSTPDLSLIVILKIVLCFVLIYYITRNYVINSVSLWTSP